MDVLPVNRNMIRLQHILFAALFPLLGLGQTSLNFSINATPTARTNMVFGISKHLNASHEIGAGLRIHVNEWEHPDNQNKLYYKRFFFEEWWQRFGITGYYHRYIFQNLKHLQPFLFYDLQLAHGKARNIDYSFFSDPVYVYGPFVWMDNSIGIGMKVFINDHWHLQQKIGLATTLVFGTNYQYANAGLGVEYLFGPMIQLGVGYQFANH